LDLLRLFHPEPDEPGALPNFNPFKARQILMRSFSFTAVASSTFSINLQSITIRLKLSFYPLFDYDIIDAEKIKPRQFGQPGMFFVRLRLLSQ
jgi:hypothetical protein